MTCTPTRPCGPGPRASGSCRRRPARRLRRRIGEFDALPAADLIADRRAARRRAARRSASAGTSRATRSRPLLARLWAYVAEGVAAYTELTAGEAYLRRRATGPTCGGSPRSSATARARGSPRRAGSSLSRQGRRPGRPGRHARAGPGHARRAAQTFEVARRHAAARGVGRPDRHLGAGAGGPRRARSCASSAIRASAPATACCSSTRRRRTRPSPPPLGGLWVLVPADVVVPGLVHGVVDQALAVADGDREHGGARHRARRVRPRPRRRLTPPTAPYAAYRVWRPRRPRSGSRRSCAITRARRRPRASRR